jgi:pilus assembly protein CpaE
MSAATFTRARAIVALSASVDSMLVEAAVSSSPGLEVAGFVHDLDANGAGLDDVRGDVLVVACEPDDLSDAADLIGRFTREHPHQPVIVLVGQSANGFVTSIIEAGADDVVLLPAATDGGALEDVGAQIVFALQKSMARKDGAAVGRAQNDGQLICVLGPKGGIGKTLTASNLAVSFADAGHRAAIVDLDLQFGDVGLVLGLSPIQTLYDLARSSGTIDEEKLEAFMVAHESGVRALLAPTRPDQASAITPEFLTSVYAALRASQAYVVVDTPPGFTPEVIASIDSASEICMVGMLDSLSLKNTRLGLETLDLMGYPPERIRVVLNRADTRVGITTDDAAAIIGREPDILVPSSRDVVRSVNDSVPIALAQPRSDAGRAFRSLAAMYERPVAANGGSPARGGRRYGLRRRSG